MDGSESKTCDLESERVVTNFGVNSATLWYSIDNNLLFIIKKS